MSRPLVCDRSVVKASDSIDLVKNELAAEVIRSVGELRLRAIGTSMLPTIWPQDVLLVRRCAIGDACLGDVILTIRHRRLFAHRVVARSGASLVTQGDGMVEPDPPVNSAEILGKVSHILRGGKFVATESSRSFSRRALSALFRRCSRLGRMSARLQNLWTRARR